jgi:hypothetical protein
MSVAKTKQGNSASHRSKDPLSFVLFQLRHRLFEVEASFVACACHVVCAEQICARTFFDLWGDARLSEGRFFSIFEKAG